MENKKSKWKHFHFLEKQDIKHPNKFLKHIFDECQIDWSRNINFLISSILSPELKSSTFDFGFNFIYLGNMIDVAFCIQKLFHPEKTNRELNQKSTSAYIISDSFFDAGLGDDFEEIAEEVCKLYFKELFNFKTHREWYVEMEGLLFLAFDPAIQGSVIPKLKEHQISCQFLSNLPNILQVMYKYSILKNLKNDNKRADKNKAKAFTDS